MRVAPLPPMDPSSRRGRLRRPRARPRRVRGDPRRGRRRTHRRVRLARQRGVERFEPSGSCEQERRRLAASIDGEADLGPRRSSARARRSSSNGPASAMASSSSAPPGAPASWLLCAAARARVRVGFGSGVSGTARWRNAAAAANRREPALGRRTARAQRRRFRRARARVGEMPRSTVWFGVRIGGVGECAVRPQALPVDAER